MIQTNLDLNSFKSASENMGYDEALLKTVDGQERIVRLYLWQHPGITFSYRQELPKELTHIDHSQRITGGGILFHSPGDITLSILSTMQDAMFPTKLKEKMQWVAEKVQQSFSELGISLQTRPNQPSGNREFCYTYQNPYELYYRGVKVLGLALRKQRTGFIIQGLIHLQSSEQNFDVNKHFRSYLSQGIGIHDTDIVLQIHRKLCHSLSRPTD